MAARDDVRALIGDLDTASPVLTDAQIDTFLSLHESDVFMAAAQAMNAIAASKALLSKMIKAGDYSENLSAAAKECREMAKSFRELADSIPADAQAEQFLTTFNEQDILINKAYRGETE
jgi:hypothetical protein